MIAPERVDQFQRDGATVLRQLFPADEIATLKPDIDENLARPSERARIASRAGVVS